MVRLGTAINTAVDVFFDHALTTAPELGGATPAIDQPSLFPLVPLNVSSTTFETILLETFGLESVGIINVGDMFATIFTVHGSTSPLMAGEIRFDISGDGGQNFKKVFQQAVTVIPNLFPPPPFLNIAIGSGAGRWLGHINVGDNQLQLRLSARSSGPVPFATQIVPESAISFVYRKSATTSE